MDEELAKRPINHLLRPPAKPPDIHKAELELPREMRRTLAQLRAQKCPLLQEYLHGIGAAEEPHCPLCRHAAHDVVHLFNCTRVQTDLTPVDLWRRPLQAAQLVQEWRDALAAAEEEA